MVIGEPQRAFYGNQYSLTMPVFTHYGVELWVPEVGGPIDPDSEAHDLIMSVFGGMSKGERTRIKLRVRAAMAAQAAIEGRFLGGRPPYGYRIADAGPHPNPAKAADGKRLHKLEPDPETARVVRRIFAEYLAGRGLFAIAEGLTRDAIPSRSQHDAARNTHRSGEGWAKSAVRAILRNPRYTGRQVWNKQRKDEILLDVNDVARGYETRLRWNDTGQWIWSDTIAQEPLASAGDFEAAQAIMAGAGRARQASHETRERVRNPYALRGRLYCGFCERRMQGQYNHGDAYYRCRYPKEYALASHVRHPGNVYLREADVLPAIDRWPPRREGSHLRPARPQGHLQARRSKNPGRSHHRPGELCRACGAMWGYGSCPRGDLNTQRREISPVRGNHGTTVTGTGPACPGTPRGVRCYPAAWPVSRPAPLTAAAAAGGSARCRCPAPGRCGPVMAAFGDGTATHTRR